VTSSEKKVKFAICLNNSGYAASLEIGRLYQVVPDRVAVDEGYLRVIDESGEDYGFEANRFHIVELPEEVERTLIAAQNADTLGLAS
jgi:hypothetical protein